MTAEDAVRYSAAYRRRLRSPARIGTPAMSDEQAPSISVKLSALFPRFEYAQRERVLAELGPRLLELVVEARSAQVALTIDTEESERLELSLELIDRVLQASVSAGWGGFGLAVQTYQKRAPDVLRWLISLARDTRRRLHVRLVKGAYWDSEIKRAQERGLSGYPVFTRKINTDVSYLACARLVLEGGEFCTRSLRPTTRTRSQRHPDGATHGALVRVPAPARHGRGALCGDRRPRQAESSVPRLRAGRRARGPVALSRASTAGERVQHFVRQSHRQRDGCRRRRSLRTRLPRSTAWHGRASTHSAAA